MGAWGTGHFENDDALDLIAEVQGPDDLDRVLRAVTESEDVSIDASVASEAMAAADIVAALMGRPADDCPEDLAKRLDALGAPAPALIKLAQESVSRVLMESELVDLWAESDEIEAWNLSVTDLIARLDNSGAGGQSKKKSKSDEINAVCPFCQETIGSDEALMLSIASVHDDPINRLDRSWFCHLACLNAKLHPKAVIQNWKVDPDDPEFQRMVDDVLNPKDD